MALCQLCCHIVYVFCLLQSLWTLLDKYQTPPLLSEEQMINYEDFLKVSSEASSKCKLVRRNVFEIHHFLDLFSL